MGENKTLELIKTIVTAVLLVSLICLCSVYIFGFGKVRAAEFSKSMMSALKAQSYKSEYAKYFDRSYVVPAFVLPTADGRECSQTRRTQGLKRFIKAFRFIFPKLSERTERLPSLMKTQASAVGNALFRETAFI